MAPPLAPELLLVILDARLILHDGLGPVQQELSVADLFSCIWDALLVLCRAHSALGSDHQFVLLGAHARRSTLLSGSESLGRGCDFDWKAARRATAEFALEDGGMSGAPMLAAAISHALCCANRLRQTQRELHARVLILDGSATESDLSSQGTPLMSCAFAAKARDMIIDCLSLGAEPSVLLRQVANISNGKHRAIGPTGGAERAADVLIPMLLFHFLPGAHVRKELNVTADVQNLAAVCACHGETQELGYVCSSCLSIFCSDAAAICPRCSTRFRCESGVDCRLSELGIEAA